MIKLFNGKPYQNLGIGSHASVMYEIKIIRRYRTQQGSDAFFQIERLPDNRRILYQYMKKRSR